MDEKEVAGLISVLILLVLVVVIIVLFTIFVKRKNKLLEEQAKTKEKFEKELAESQIEIREETLRNISWELHDNIGQLMTLAKIQVQSCQDDLKNIDEAAKTIGTALHELRTLSKLINPEALKSLTLPQAVEMEIARFNRLNFITSTFAVEGLPKKIDSKKEIILFRILQEFFSNTIKHSKATHLNVAFHYSGNRLQIFAKDDGVGFLDSSNFSGIGLKNMKSRAQLIHAKLDISSIRDQGTSLRLEYSFY
ncbi:histidine kinase [Flavobacteriaceae bacterium F89]|uniref:histidine kinase n=1 Tax=Cerina litoralis TaxID=2874477 RepID=A0AAE3EVG7_9FLAO|nr:ATP-binding protein [Cerina litoralis]MCG2461825.1 histidine kinase [Cerina litoralis]